MAKDRRKRGVSGAMVATVAVALVAVLAWAQSPAAADPAPFGPAPAPLTFTVGTAQPYSAAASIAGAVDLRAGTFTATLTVPTPAKFRFPISDSTGTYPATPYISLTQSMAGSGTLDPDSGTATFDATLTLALDAWYADDLGDTFFVTDFDPCRFDLPLSLSGSYDPATGAVSLADAAFTVAPAADYCGDPNGNAAVNAALAGTVNSAALSFALPVAGVPPTLSSAAPTSGPVGATVVLTGTGFVPGATVVNFGATVIAGGSVLVTNDGKDAAFAVPSGAALGGYAISVATPNGTSGSVAFTVTASAALGGSFLFVPDQAMAVTGAVESILYTDGTYDATVLVDDGVWSAIAPESTPIAGTPVSYTYRVAPDGPATGTVDAAAGTATLSARLVLTLTSDQNGPYIDGFRYALVLSLTGSYDPFTGAVSLQQQPFSVGSYGDNCQRPNDPPEVCEDFDPTMLVNGWLLAEGRFAQMDFALPSPIDRSPAPTTTTQPVTTSTPVTSTAPVTSTTSVASTAPAPSITPTTGAEPPVTIPATTAGVTPTSSPEAPPTLDVLVPTSGAAGTAVVATGSGFIDGDTTVWVGGVAVPGTVAKGRAAASELVFIIPDDAPLGAVDILIETVNGTSDAQSFTVLEATADTATAPSDQPPFAGVAGASGGQADGTQGLARTGTEAGTLAPIGVGLVMVGLALAALRRRRLTA